jgi:acetyltransferase-like isoleucine patch superfamily enzyme
LGNNVQIGRHSKIHCDTEIGSNVLIAENVAFVGRDDHTYKTIGRTIWDSPRGDAFKTVIENDVWIGHGAILISGITVGRGSVISAGSVVVKDVPPYSIAGGNPARFVKWRFNQAEIVIHEKLLNRA